MDLTLVLMCNFLLLSLVFKTLLTCPFHALYNISQDRSSPNSCDKKFPKDFIWGASSSAYQIEGGWNEDCKGPSIWDTFTHRGHINNKDTGDVACDSYHKAEDDVELLKNLGVSYYRFSIAWSRVLPDGTTKKINHLGVKYYNDLIDKLLAHYIQPAVTLYHFDLPQALQDIGGWLNPSVADLFSDYAQFCFKTFGNRVKLWFTLNEPWVDAFIGYGLGTFAPGIKELTSAPYKASKVQLLAHAKAWHVYDDHFRSQQNGKISIVLNTNWMEPKTESLQDKEAANRSIQWWLGLYAHPVFVSGDYPEVIKKIVQEKSSSAGIPNRLPSFTAEEKSFIKGTADFFGLNLYSASYSQHMDFPVNISWDFVTDQQTKTSVDPSWIKGAPPWLFNVPWSLGKMLLWIKQNYNNPEIMITENGFAVEGEDDLDEEAALNDVARVEYLRGYIGEMLRMIQEQGVRVKGYFVWSLLDNFEWADGYRFRFGLHRVDFKDPNRRRTPKLSAFYYRDVIRCNGRPLNKYFGGLTEV